MNNVYSDPAYAAILVDLQAELKRLQVQYQDTELTQ
jgi:hypothetical protein